MAYNTVNLDESALAVLPGGKCGAAFTVATPLYRDSSGVLQKAQAVDVGTAIGSRKEAIGFAWKITLINEFLAPVKSLFVRGFSGETIGAPVYLSATAGTLTTTEPTHQYVKQIVGRMVAADEAILFADEVEDRAILLGAAQGTTGVPMTTLAQPLQVHGVIASAASTNAYASIYGTQTLTATQTNNVSVFCGWFEHYITGGTIQLNGNHGALWGNLEISGTVATGGSTSSYMGAVIGTIIAPATLTVSNITACFVADSNITTGITNNSVVAAFAAIVSPSHPTKRSWDCGLYLLGVDNVISFNGAATDYLNGVKIGAISGLGATASGCMRLRDVLNSTYYYVPLYAAGDLAGE